jgi:nitrogen regulatory protein P-II 1
MKLVIAIIQPDKLDTVRESLLRNGIYRITVSRCAGRGQAQERDAQETDLDRGQEVAPDLIAKVRLEIACNDDFVEPAIEAISDAARHDEGAIGDGKIWVLPLEQCVRIRTGDRGNPAI